MCVCVCVPSLIWCCPQVTTKKQQHYLLARDVTESTKWVKAIQETLFKSSSPPANAAPSSTDVEHNDIYESVDKVCQAVGPGFLVQVDTETRARLRVEWTVRVVVEEGHISLFSTQGKVMVRWLIIHIRKFGFTEHEFYLEAGRKSESGPGVFTFSTTEGERITILLHREKKLMRHQLMMMPFNPGCKPVPPSHGPLSVPPSHGPKPVPPSHGPKPVPPSHGPKPVPPSHGPKPVPPSHGPKPVPPSHGPKPVPPSHGPQPVPPRHSPTPVPPRHGPLPELPSPGPKPVPPSHGPKPVPPSHGPKPVPPSHDPKPVPPRHGPKPVPPRHSPLTVPPRHCPLPEPPSPGPKPVPPRHDPKTVPPALAPSPCPSSAPPSPPLTPPR
ncbi:hypothetical protein GWK47_051641 [Chionoecetes opilio]|uniref:IRS-type PTB domain-containing protein n=1 Tax=Chionoecetes opilio TaxID=41210 RepID=A0A8J5CS95_CHIOP|nr:hypothetical protein GWK47_051641 [Chionoecetes opilio]